MDPGTVTTRRQVAVVDDENAAFGVPRLLLRDTGGPGTTGAVTWELCYGGLPIASGSLEGDQEALFTDVAGVQPSMDGAGLTITARREDGAPCEIEAICVRPMRPPTRAEAAARARWPGARNQHETPALRRPFVAEIREALPVAAGPGIRPGARRRVHVYQHFSALLAYRRRSLHRPRAASAPGQDG